WRARIRRSRGSTARSGRSWTTSTTWRLTRRESLAGRRLQAAHVQLVGTAPDRLREHIEAGVFHLPDVGEVDGEVAHALADQARHRGAAFVVQLATEAEQYVAVFDRGEHLEHASHPGWAEA